MPRILKTVAISLLVLLAAVFLTYPRARMAHASRFSEWTENYLKSGAQVSEGVALAKKRHAEMLELIQHDPQKALTQAIPQDIRQTLPREIVDELEQPFDSIGDINVHCALRARGGPAIDPRREFVVIGGQRMRAHFYGRREHETTKLGIPLRGIALDGHAAVDENTLKPTTESEAAKSGKTIVDLTSFAGQIPSNSAPAFAELNGRVYKFASPLQRDQAEARIRAAESTLDPVPPVTAEQALTQNVEVASRSANSEGAKKILFIRVDFSDKSGDAVNPFTNATLTASYCQNLVDTVVAPYYAQSSYGITSQTNTVTTQLYRMPQTGSFYATNGADDQLHTDAQTLASANYTLNNFDRIAVVFPDLGTFQNSQIDYAGLADLGGKKLWINGYFDFATIAHELGHTYGLDHANLWKVSDSNPISPSGSTKEYGDDFDTMGGNFDNDVNVDFNPWFKRMLNWIPAASVNHVTQAGTYRVTRIDGGINTGTLALTVTKDASRTYWITCRKIVASQPIQTGAYIIWGYNVNQQSNLLDMVTPGSDATDAPLPLNSTFHDSALNLNITPIANGGTAPNEYVDIQISFGGAVATTTTAADVSATFKAISQNVTLNAIVSGGGAVNEGTVTFQIKDGTSNIGSAVTSPTLTNGAASVTYALPAGLLPKTYTIAATYSGSNQFSASGDSTHALTIAGPTSPTFVSPPFANPSAPAVGQTVTFGATAISATGDSLTYSWTFGDGAVDSGSTVTHAYTSPGTYVVSCIVSNGKGGSDTAGFNLMVSNPVYGSGGDSDSDGFSDSFETLYGTDPNSGSSNPLGSAGGQPPPPTPLTLTGLQIKFNFIKTSVDGLMVKGTLPLPIGTSFSSKILYVGIGPKVLKFTLDANGHSAPRGLDNATVSKPAKGVAKFTVKSSKANLTSVFAPMGITSNTPTGTPVVLTVNLFFDGVGYEAGRTPLLKSNGKAATLK